MPEIESTDLRETLGDLVVASHRLTRLAARVTGNTESPATWRTLSVLQTVGAMRLGELAAHSRVSQPTMTKIVHNLVETEWVKRIADVDDARAWQIAITPKGAAALQSWRDELSGGARPDVRRPHRRRAGGAARDRRASSARASSIAGAAEPAPQLTLSV